MGVFEMKIFLGRSFSCSLNYQEGYIFNALASKHEITKEVSEADIIVFPSTCACTESIMNSIFAYMYDCLEKKKPTAKVYLTGCLTRPFKDKELNKWMEDWFRENIDFVVPHNTPNLLLQKISSDFSYLQQDAFGCCVENSRQNIMQLYIGNGCLNNCAFCKLSYQFYPLTSMTLEEAKLGIDYAAQRGFSTIEFIATNVSQVGIDLYGKPILPELVRYAEAKEGIEKVKIVGFAFKDAIRYKFQNFLAECSKVDYVSGALETGSPRLLKVTRKGFTPEEMIEFVKDSSGIYKKRWDLNVIAGLPTETIDDVQETLRVLRKLDPYSVNICEYVNSQMLELSTLPQLSDDEISEHARMYEEALSLMRVKTYLVKKPR